MINQGEYNVSKQFNRIISIKIDLLNHKFQKVDEITGNLIGTPTFSNNSDSDIRRTCSFSLIPTDASFDIENGSKIWMDKYVKIYLGIKDNKTNEVIFTSQGIYMIQNPNYAYSSIDNTITIQGIDLMAKLTGLRNGNLEGIPYVIKEGSNVKEAVIALLKLAGFNNYVIEEYEISVPYEIKVDIGGTIFDILKELRDLLPNYQMYFDVDGVFRFEKIPSGNNEQIFIDDDVWSKTLLSYTKSIDYSTIKNVIEVFGKTHDITNYGGNATIDGNTYKITVSNISELIDYLKIGFTITDVISEPHLKINEFESYPILDNNGKYPNFDEGEQYYVVKFHEDNDGYFEFLGNVQPYAIAKEENPDSPFYIKGNLGEIRIVLSGGEYNNIYSNALAQERANWELYSRCKLKDNLTITCIPVYWADVNKLISITLPSNSNNEKELYIIKSINTTYGTTGTQTIECMKYYPFYADYVRNLKGE